MATPTVIQQIRLIVGDTAGDFPFLDDSTYQWLISLYPTNIYAAAVDALEMIINQLALSPQSIKTQDLTEIGPLVASLEARLTSLKAKAVPSRKGFPMIVKSDRTNWNDFNTLFGTGNNDTL